VRFQQRGSGVFLEGKERLFEAARWQRFAVKPSLRRTMMKSKLGFLVVASLLLSAGAFADEKKPNVPTI
jgi:hypothetical protein